MFIYSFLFTTETVVEANYVYSEVKIGRPISKMLFKPFSVPSYRER